MSQSPAKDLSIVPHESSVTPISIAERSSPSDKGSALHSPKHRTSSTDMLAASLSKPPTSKRLALLQQLLPEPLFPPLFSRVGVSMCLATIFADTLTNLVLDLLGHDHVNLSIEHAESYVVLLFVIRLVVRVFSLLQSTLYAWNNVSFHRQRREAHLGGMVAVHSFDFAVCLTSVVIGAATYPALESPIVAQYVLVLRVVALAAHWYGARYALGAAVDVLEMEYTTISDRITNAYLFSQRFPENLEISNALRHFIVEEVSGVENIYDPFFLEGSVRSGAGDAENFIQSYSGLTSEQIATKFGSGISTLGTVVSRHRISRRDVGPLDSDSDEALLASVKGSNVKKRKSVKHTKKAAPLASFAREVEDGLIHNPLNPVARGQSKGSSANPEPAEKPQDGSTAVTFTEPSFILAESMRVESPIDESHASPMASMNHDPLVVDGEAHLGHLSRRSSDMIAISKQRTKSIASMSRSVTSTDTFSKSESLENILDWDFNIFAARTICEDTGGVLVRVGYELGLALQIYGDIVDEDRWICLLSAVQACYNDNPYHNATHAADVLQTFFAFASVSGVLNNMSDLDKLAMAFACIIHDVEHPGVNNAFLVNTLDDLAIRYNDKSVLESHHVARGFQLLRDRRNDITSKLDATELRQFRNLVMAVVLGTDMADHMPSLNAWRAKITAATLNGPYDDGLLLHYEDEKVTILKMLMHAADVSNPAKSQELAVPWAHNVMAEFKRQGELEMQLKIPVSTMCEADADIGKCQVGFIEFVVLPLFTSIVDFAPNCDFILRYIHENKEYWSVKPSSDSPNIVLERQGSMSSNTTVNSTTNQSKLTNAKRRQSIGGGSLLPMLSHSGRNRGHSFGGSTTSSPPNVALPVHSGQQTPI